MARRRSKELEIWEVAGPVAGLLMMLTAFSPQARQAILGLGFIAASLMVLAVLAIIVFAICRHFWNAEKTTPDGSPPVTVACRTPTAPALRPCATTADVLGQSHPPAPSDRFSPSPRNSQDLAAQLRTIDWFQFEKLVEFAYRKHDYSVQRRGGANPDGGIDLLIRKDGETKAVQCKHWKTSDVGVKDIREFLGALTHAKLTHGIFITLQGYTAAAKQLADSHGIELVTESSLLKLLNATDSRFDPKLKELLTDQQKYCPKCESAMVLRTAKKGNNAGQHFWGCSTYPRCSFTLQA